MAERDIITMRSDELRRLGIVEKVLNEEIKQVEAAEFLELSSRQVNRIVKRVMEEGDKGIIHRLRGKESNRKLPRELRERVLKKYRAKYIGFGPTLAMEKLSEIDEIDISDETLRNWLIEAGEWQKRRKGRKHRQWRERKGRYGEMVQMDGSHHDWLEGRGPWLVLMGYIDDATGKVYARFYSYEGTIPALDSFKRYMRENGIPHSIYFDKHTTYKSWAKPTIEDELSGEMPLSQFERVLKELGVEVIHANSPQAKGRVERLFNTLQDRLVKEMRLKGIKTMEEANEFTDGYLPEFNAKFNVIAREKGDMHRKIPKGIRLDRVLCIKTSRALRNDFTVAHDKRLYQVLERTDAKQVIVEEYINGSMRIYSRDRSLRYKEIFAIPQKIKKVKISELPFSLPRGKYIPPPNHPWRRSNLFYMNRYPVKHLQ